MSIPVGSLEIRMARLEGAYEQINVRLSDLSAELRAAPSAAAPRGERWPDRGSGREMRPGALPKADPRRAAQVSPEHSHRLHFTHGVAPRSGRGTPPAAPGIDPRRSPP